MMKVEEFLAEWHNDSPYVHVQTSGSTGAPKPMLVEKRRMLNSARITCDFLGLRPGDTALLCMSLDYIAGKMMVVRAIERGLCLIVQEPDGHPMAVKMTQRGQSLMCFAGSAHEGQSPCVISPCAHEGQSPCVISPCVTFAAMVPMQVWNTLQVPEERERLMQIKHLIIGGGAIDDALAAELRNFPNAVWSTYGMTETLSHIALRRLSGPEASDWYTPFPSVKVSLSDEGCLVIDASEVCAEPLVTNDIAVLTQGVCPSCAELAEHIRDCPLCVKEPAEHIRDCPLCVSPRFRILARKDNVICTGGIKIQAEEVERQLHPHLRSPYLISKRSDPKFGEIVVLLTEGPVDEARQVCERFLPKYYRPRVYLHIDRIPLTATGKPARKEAALIAK